MKNSKREKQYSSKNHGVKAVLAGLCTLAAVTTQADNLLVNGDFESATISPWSGAGTLSSPLWDVDGRHAIEATGAVKQTLTLSPHTTYRLSGTLMPRSGTIKLSVSGDVFEEASVSESSYAGADLRKKRFLVFRTQQTGKVDVILETTDGIAYADDIVLEKVHDTNFDYGPYGAPKPILLPPVNHSPKEELVENGWFSNYRTAVLAPWSFASWGSKGTIAMDPLHGDVTMMYNTVGKVVGSGACNQIVTVKPNTVYRLTGLSYRKSGNVTIGVKGQGTTESFSANVLPASEYGWMEHEVLFTTGNSTELRVYAYVSKNGGEALVDDISLTEAADQKPYTPTGEAPAFPGSVRAEYYDAVWIDGELVSPQGISAYSSSPAGSVNRYFGVLKGTYECEYSKYGPDSNSQSVLQRDGDWSEYTVKFEEKANNADWTLTATVQTYDPGMQIEFSIDGEVLGTATAPVLSAWNWDPYRGHSDDRFEPVSITVPNSVMGKYEGGEAVLRIKTLGGSGESKILTVKGE